MKKEIKSLYSHVEKSLNPYRWIASISISLLISFIFASFYLKSKIEADHNLLESLSPYIATLVESSDRPELLRILRNAASKKSLQLILESNGHVFASSGSTSDLDTTFLEPKSKIGIFDSKYFNNDLISEVSVRKSDASPILGKLYLYSSVSQVFNKVILLFFTALLFCLLISSFLFFKIKEVIKKALHPMSSLHEQIRLLSVGGEITVDPLPIKELEEIRVSLIKAKIDLENVKERLAEEKAKKLSAEAFKGLIHDLHSPVAALRQYIKIINDENANDEVKNTALLRIPNISDQILNQVTSAKKNLEDEPIALRDLNIIDSIKECIHQMTLLSQKNISLETTNSEIFTPHDPELLKRALINLIENGSDAAKNQVRLSVDQINDETIIKVCDDGAGMDESDVSLYLQGRGRSSKANRQAFGLSTTNHIIRSHGGKLIYKRSDLGGSSFEIRLGAL